MTEKTKYSELYKELELLEDYGINITLESSSATAFQVVQAHMIKEEGAYMRDYVLDDGGHLKEVQFNKVSPRSK